MAIEKSMSHLFRMYIRMVYVEVRTLGQDYFTPNTDNFDGKLSIKMENLLTQVFEVSKRQRENALQSAEFFI